MSKLVMNIKNEQNMKAMVAWCEQYHIAYQILEDASSQPNLVMDDQVKTVSKPVAKASKPDPLKGSEKKHIAPFVDLYPSVKGVRYWEATFTPDKVKYGIKASLKEAGATWDDNLKCFKFDTKKEFDAWVKAQKARG